MVKKYKTKPQYNLSEVEANYCKRCSCHSDCGYVIRELEGDCRELEIFSLGYEKGKEEVMVKACDWMKLYVLNHDTIDIFEMEEEFKKTLNKD